MSIWVKLKVFAPKDYISNVGTKFQTIDGKRQLVDPKGSLPFQIKKGEVTTIPFEWKPVYEKNETGKKVMVTPGLEEAKKKFPPEVFELFKTKEAAEKQCKKELKLLAMLPTMRLEEKRKRIQKKVDTARWGQTKPTMEDVIREAKRIGVDVPLIK
ncbi:MAG: hypothetical protein E3J56_01035 [Candidatus Aminicenantes bacterium]|nr:MAG: hypothetical protein E3J56_01035 [Candidatus Aminicenantes bacterium]